MTKYKVGIAAGLSVLALATSQSAFAQEENAQPSYEGIEEITVTAQRRAERLQDVPIAVSAFSAQDLETRQISRTIDLLNYVPNLIGHNNTSVGTANSYSMRGLNNNETISTFDLPVGTYVDDVYMSRQSANNFALFDVERIEVLRGPQGTLFGRNTTGGAINVIMRKPGNEFGGTFEVGYGRYDRFSARGSIDLPLITDKLLTKVQAYYVNDDGYVNNRTTGEQLNSEESYGFRGAVRAFLSDTVTWDVTADYNSQSYANFPNFYDPATKSRVSYTRLRTDQTAAQVFADVAPGAEYLSPALADNKLGNLARTWSVTSNFEVEAGDNLTINFITGYRHIFNEYLTDSPMSLNLAASQYAYPADIVNPVLGNTSLLANDSYHGQFSQEVKATGTALDDRLNYVAGLFYIREQNKTIFANASVSPTGVGTLFADRTMRNSTVAYAAFFQADYKITDALTATAGIRFTAEDKDIQFSPNASPLTPTTANPPFDTQDIINAGLPVEQKARVWTPRFALNYKINPDVSVFASATKGFKSGGWVSRAYNAETMFPFDRETIWSFEGGLRSEWFNRRLRFNATAFYFNDMDNQLPAGRENPLSPGNLIYTTQNFADLRNYGLETEVVIVPVTGLNISWTAGLQHARFKNLNQSVLDQQQDCLDGVANTCNAGIVTADGRIAKPSRVAPFNTTVGINYTAHLNDDLQLIPSVTWAYTDGSWPSAQNDVRGYQKSHHLFNAGLSLKNLTDGWTLSADCSNCFNKRYVSSFLLVPYLNEPGRWTIRARYEF